MSVAAASADDCEPDIEPAALPDAVRRHIGQLLAQAYAQTEPATDTAARFADLLAKFDEAIRSARAGSDVAFRDAMVAHTSALRRFAVSLTHNPTAADDLVQDTLVRAWRSRSGFVPGTNFEAWTFTILRNLFYSDRRKQGREVQDEDGVHAARLASPPDQVDCLDLTDMRTALARLTAPMREALVLVALENLSYEQAAEVMRCQVGTVKSRVWRARYQLAKALGYCGSEIGQGAVMQSAMAIRAKVPC